MFSSLAQGVSRAARFFASRNEKVVLIEALERREMLTGEGEIENLAPMSTPGVRSYIQLGTPSIKIDLWGMFTDETPSELLIYGAGSNSNPAQVPGTDIIDNRYLLLTFNAHEPGEVLLSVTATDPQGLTGEHHIEYSFDPLANNPPEVVMSGDITVEQGSSPVVINLDAIFEDLGTDDSLLEFYFSSNNNSKLVTSAVVEGHNLTLTFAPDKSGYADIWVVCKDPNGNTTGHPIQVLVNPLEGGGGEEPLPNSSPLAFAVEPIVLEFGVTSTKIDMWQSFQDSETPSQDLVFAVTGSTNSDFIVGTSFSEDGRYLTVTLNGSKVDSGILTVTCTDPEFLSATNDFSISYSEAVNNPPVVVGTPIIEVDQDSAPVLLDLHALFDDFNSPDSELSFEVSSFSNPGLIASAKIEGKNLVVAFNGHQHGMGGITVVATDPQGKSTPVLVQAFVADVIPVVGALRSDLTHYRHGSLGLTDVDFTISGVVAENNKVALYLDKDNNGLFSSAVDEFLTFATSTVGALRVASADLSGLATGDYQILAVGQEDLGTGSFQYGSAVYTTVHIVGTDKSLVSAKNVVTYTDANGNTVKAALTGPGTLEAFFDTSAAKHNPSLIQVVGSDAGKSSLTFTVTATKGSGSLTTTVGEFAIEGGLVAIHAGKVDLSGSLTATGFIKALTLNDVASGTQHHIHFAGTGADKSTITLASVANVSLNTAATVSLKAHEWIDTDIVQDTIHAASLSSLSITGYKAKGEVIRGNFDADVTLSDTFAGKTAPNISSISIAGDTSGDWHLGASKTQSITIKGHATGDWSTKTSIGPIAITGMVSNLHVTAGGNIASFKGGQTNDTFIHSNGAIGTITTVNFLAGGIQGVKVNSITTTGLKATAGVPAVAGNFTGTINLTGEGLKSGAVAANAITVAGLASGSTESTHPDWEVRGGVGTITVGQAQNLHVQVGMGTEAGLTSFKAGQATHVDLQVALKIGTVTATNWTGGSISAGSVGALNITGTPGKGGSFTGGDFTGELNLNGIGTKNGLTLSSANIKGTLLGQLGSEAPDWFINGNVGSVTAGDVFSFGLNISPIEFGPVGNLASLKIGAADAMRLDVHGKIGSLNTTNWVFGRVHADSVGSLTSTGGFTGKIRIAGEHLAKNALGLGNLKVTGTASGSGSLENPDWHIVGSSGPMTIGATNTLAIAVNDALSSLTVTREAKNLNLLVNGHFDEATSKNYFGSIGTFTAGKITNSYVQTDKITSISVKGTTATKGSTPLIGDIVDTFFYITGGGLTATGKAVGTLTVSGTMNNSTLSVVSGDVGSVTLGAIRDSAVTVAVADDLPENTLPTSDAGFASTAFSIGSFTVTGRAVPANTVSFINSRVIAGTLKGVSLKLVSGEVGEGQESGLAAAIKINAYTRDQLVGPDIKVNNKTLPGTYDTVGAYVLKIV